MNRVELTRENKFITLLKEISRKMKIISMKNRLIFTNKKEFCSGLTNTGLIYKIIGMEGAKVL